MLIISILTRTTNNTQLICYTRVHVCIVPARWTIKFVFLFLPAVWVLYEFICNQFLSCEYCYNLNTCGCRDRIIIIIIFLQDLNAREPLAHRLLHTWHMCLHCPCWLDGRIITNLPWGLIDWALSKTSCLFLRSVSGWWATSRGKEGIGPPKETEIAVQMLLLPMLFCSLLSGLNCAVGMPCMHA
jgi:hypothetical protein